MNEASSLSIVPVLSCLGVCGMTEAGASPSSVSTSDSTTLEMEA